MIEASSAPLSRPPDRLDALRAGWREQGSSVSDLAELVKLDLRRRFAEGDRPAVAEYLASLPELQEEADRVLSLIYEEFCLREEAGEAPDPDSFCNRYAPWRDSLASQLNYHQMLSQAAGVATARPPRFPEPGEHFLRFRLRSMLGQGGAARVFLADDEDLGGRLSALKVSPDRGEEPSIMGRLEHPNIMPVHTVVRDPVTGLRGLCMPYRPGRPLDQVLGRMANIPPEKRTARTLLEAASPDDLASKPGGRGWEGYPRRGRYADACAWLGAALADALAHSHSLKILHRDVKPANILLSAANGPQLLDFNLAHDPHAPERAESALRGGTLPYMAPEQIEAFRDPKRWDRVGPTADLYALGLVLRELLTGRRPDAPTADLPLPRAINDLLSRRANGWPTIRSVNPTVPFAMEAIVGRCLAHDPAQRYPSASALAEDLRAFLRRRPLRHVTNPSRRERTQYWLRRNRIALASAAMLAVSIGAFPLVVTPKHLLNEAMLLTERYDRLPFGHADRPEYLRSAEFRFRLALWLDPDNYRAHRGLGKIAREREQLDKARAHLTESIRLAETTGTANLHYLAETYKQLAEVAIAQARASASEEEVGFSNRSDSSRYLDALKDVNQALSWAARVEDSTVSNRILAEIHAWKGATLIELAYLDTTTPDFERWLDDARTSLEKALELGLDSSYTAMARQCLEYIDRRTSASPGTDTNHSQRETLSTPGDPHSAHPSAWSDLARDDEV